MKPTQRDVEERIVGQCFFDGAGVVLKASEIVDETDFDDPGCSILFGVCLALVGQQKSVDELSVYHFLKNNAGSLGIHFQRLSNITDTQTALNNLSNLATDLVTQYERERSGYNDLRSNCIYIKQEARRRKAKEVILSAGKGLNDDNDVDEVIEQAVQELITPSVNAQYLRSHVSIEDAFDEAIKETADEIAGKVVRLSTGFAGLDRIIYGLERGRLYCIAAEEKIGKSLLSYQIGLNTAGANHPTAIISLEMRAVEIAKRFAGVNSGQEALIRLNALKRTKQEIDTSPLYIRDGSATTREALLTIHKLVSEKRIELVIIDYLQLVELQNRDRVNEVNDFVSRLKGVAMDLQIPVVLISAVLNKQIIHRSERKPTPADIRDTGRLANDADCLMFLWKPDEMDESYVELFVSRSRYSKLGRIGLSLNPDTLKLLETTLRDADEVPLKQYQTKKF